MTDPLRLATALDLKAALQTLLDDMRRADDRGHDSRTPWPIWRRDGGLMRWERQLQTHLVLGQCWRTVWGALDPTPDNGQPTLTGEFLTLLEDLMAFAYHTGLQDAALLMQSGGDLAAWADAWNRAIAIEREGVYAALQWAWERRATE